MSYSLENYEKKKKSEDFGFVNGKTSAYTGVENSFLKSFSFKSFSKALSGQKEIKIDVSYS